MLPEHQEIKDLLDEAVVFLKGTTLGYGDAVRENPNVFSSTRWGRGLDRIGDAVKKVEQLPETPPGPEPEPERYDDGTYNGG